MIRKEDIKLTDLDFEKKKEEYFNEYGYNLSFNKEKEESHFKDYAYTNQKVIKKKPKQ